MNFDQGHAKIVNSLCYSRFGSKYKNYGIQLIMVITKYLDSQNHHFQIIIGELDIGTLSSQNRNSKQMVNVVMKSIEIRYSKRTMTHRTSIEINIQTKSASQICLANGNSAVMINPSIE